MISLKKGAFEDAPLSGDLSKTALTACRNHDSALCVASVAQVAYHPIDLPESRRVHSSLSYGHHSILKQVLACVHHGRAVRTSEHVLPADAVATVRLERPPKPNGVALVVPPITMFEQPPDTPLTHLVVVGGETPPVR